MCYWTKVGYEDEHSSENMSACFVCDKGDDEVHELYNITLEDGTVYHFHEDCLKDTISCKNGLKGVDVALLITNEMKRQESEGMIDLEITIPSNMFDKLTKFAETEGVSVEQASSTILKNVIDLMK